MGAEASDWYGFRIYFVSARTAGLSFYKRIFSLFFMTLTVHSRCSSLLIKFYDVLVTLLRADNMFRST